MNEYRDDTLWCHCHPTELIVGVCALCLNERLLVLASKKSHIRATNRDYRELPKRVLPKISDFTCLFSRLDIKQQKSEVYYSSSTSPEDSFISIKFEENGVVSWDKEKTMDKPQDQQCEMSYPWDGNWEKSMKIRSVVEHAKPLKWRKRIGNLFQLIRWKRSTKRKMCQFGTKLGGGKVKYGWIRTLTKNEKGS